MPQFDVNLLSTQNINLLAFYATYLFYVMNFFNIVFFYIKNSYKLLMSLFLYIYKDIIYFIFVNSFVFYILLCSIIKIRIILNVFFFEGKQLFFYK